VYCGGSEGRRLLLASGRAPGRKAMSQKRDVGHPAYGNLVLVAEKVRKVVEGVECVGVLRLRALRSAQDDGF